MRWPGASSVRPANGQGTLETQVKGGAQEVKGKVENAWGKAKDAMRDTSRDAERDRDKKREDVA